MNTEALRPKIKYDINNEFEKLNKDKITPWAFFRTDVMQPIAKFDGSLINYKGIEFSGSAELVFWEGFIEPFLKDIIVRKIDWAIELSQQYDYPPKDVLLIAKSYLLNGIERSYCRMQEIDRKLRGRGYPQIVPLNDISHKIKQIEKFLDEYLNAAIIYSPKAITRRPKKEIFNCKLKKLGIELDLIELIKRLSKWFRSMK